MSKYRHKSGPKYKQQGVALIVVLLVLAVMVSLAATMSERLFINFQHAENQRDSQQAYWYAIGVEALAKYAVTESKKDSDTINMSQPWALEEQVFPLDYGQAAGKIRDMQSCYNINVLAASSSQQLSEGETKPYLVSVLQLTLEELGIENYQAEVFADSVREYLDADDRSLSNFGVEDSTYEALSPAYMAANGILADASELRSIYQTDPRMMTLIAPVLCAIPQDDWRLNINTLDEKGAVILAALFSPQLSVGDARSLVENRPFDGWESVDEFLSEASLSGIDSTITDKAKGYLAVDSSYFELDAQILVNESRVRVRSLLYVNDNDEVSVIRRRFGGISE
ncbi:type II secretion system minor pseudopilin GspK [Vibrio sp. JC009]|uniref:type II secretion system minor pseudopilin GspK n=1 Tax=Vibrio sp. JC009 TaxID=2912314 RepID=UPI0023B05866|nr:type II secretion system minor pseudopilin GspK [Vibrio sp. JC009]WED21932.1 type II secretion system minor pseudopilin GspK [Vibrio sp. JC009]